jgi:uncharacterized protein YjiS (DUF1127 family)
MSAKIALRLWPATRLTSTIYAQRVAALLRLWIERRRQREELLRLSELDLRDIGLTPADRSWIARDPFWRSHPFVDNDRRQSAR